MLKPLDPSDRRTRAHVEPIRRLMARGALTNCRNYPQPQIIGIGLWHRSLSYCQLFENPDSISPGRALVRLSGEHGIGLFVDGANYDDVARDTDQKRRTITVSKLAKFQQLRDVPIPDESKLIARFGLINSDNDQSDVRFLVALDAKAIDFVITQDIGLHRRAERAGLGARVFTVEEALEWLKRTFGVKPVNFP
jgi:hypothetical protein